MKPVALDHTLLPRDPIASERTQLRDAARAFEAIFLRQMLAATRAASFADETPFSGPGLEQFTAMRDEHLADISAGEGALGIAAQIEAQLSAMVEQKERG